MRKNLFAVISAVFCGILVVFVPLCVWHQVSFPDTPFTPSNVRKKVMESLEGYGVSLVPFYVTLILSSLASMVAYVFSKRRV